VMVGQGIHRSTYKEDLKEGCAMIVALLDLHIL
jgi:hypothetical protein